MDPRWGQPAGAFSVRKIASVLEKELGDEVLSLPGVSFSFEGEAQSTIRSFESLFVAFWVAICIIYLILTTQFRSAFHPFVILSNVAFAFTGVVLVMALLALLSDVLPPGAVRAEVAQGGTVRHYPRLADLGLPRLHVWAVCGADLSKCFRFGPDVGDA